MCELPLTSTRNTPRSSTHSFFGAPKIKRNQKKSWWEKREPIILARKLLSRRKNIIFNWKIIEIRLMFGEEQANTESFRSVLSPLWMFIVFYFIFRDFSRWGVAARQPRVERFEWRARPVKVSDSSRALTDLVLVYKARTSCWFFQVTAARYGITSST